MLVGARAPSGCRDRAPHSGGTDVRLGRRDGVRRRRPGCVRRGRRASTPFRLPQKRKERSSPAPASQGPRVPVPGGVQPVYRRGGQARRNPRGARCPGGAQAGPRRCPGCEMPAAMSSAMSSGSAVPAARAIFVAGVGRDVVHRSAIDVQGLRAPRFREPSYWDFLPHPGSPVGPAEPPRARRIAQRVGGAAQGSAEPPRPVLGDRAPRRDSEGRDSAVGHSTTAAAAGRPGPLAASPRHRWRGGRLILSGGAAAARRRAGGRQGARGAAD